MGLNTFIIELQNLTDVKGYLNIKNLKAVRDNNF